MEDNRKKALVRRAGPDRKAVRQGLGHAPRRRQRATYDVEAVSTGSLGLDIALGVGGLPRGRVVEIYGPESSGKTTLTLQVIAEVAAASAAPPRSSMPSTRSIPSTPRSSASTSTSCWSRSRTPASRRSRSPTCWCAPARSTSSSSTRSRR